jgi:hypothetical protein
MRVRHVAPLLFVLVPAAFIGCDAKKKTMQALAEAASAQALASAMSSPSAMGAISRTLSGNVHSVGGDLGTWDMTLDECQSGEINGFYGVDFYVAGNNRMRYVHDEAKGEIVKLKVPETTNWMVFDRNAQCAVVEGNIEKTNVTTWTPKGNIRHVSGHVKFDCTNSKGKGHVTGEATFAHCSAPR